MISVGARRPILRHLSSSSTAHRTIPALDCPATTDDDDDDDAQHHIVQLLRPYFEAQQPVILRDYASAWPALHLWKDWNYLRERVGTEGHVDVELGAYNNAERMNIPFGSYIDYLELWREEYGSEDEDKNEASEAPPVLYLAQNDLPPPLQADIFLPPFLENPGTSTISKADAPSDSAVLGEGKLYQCMFWMGPPTATSPLHFDPLDNLLTQVAGTKRVVLVDPQEAPLESLYTGPSYGQQENTSAVPVGDLLRDDDGATGALQDYPQFDQAWAIRREGRLEAGDALYIPSKWWHYVDSLSFTISVNVWWR
jgi:hypothetical protein